MKKTKIALFLAALAAVLFAGCSNISGGDVDNSGSTKSFTAKVTVDKNTVNFKKNTVSRSILPDDWKLSDDDPELVFYLAYEKAGDTSFTVETTPITVTADKSSTTSGTFLITLPQASYTLHLFGVPKGTTTFTATADGYVALAEAAALVGTTSADLRRGDSISFNLKADSDILTGKSTALLVFYSKDDWYDATVAALYPTVKAELQNPITGETIDGTSQAATIKKETEAGGISDITADTASYNSDTGVKAGSYNLVVSFSTNGATPVTYEYSDTIVIVPGKQTTKVIGIPKVVGTVPEAPANLKAAYIEPDGFSDEYYNVEFQWDDKSDNEAYFELQIADVTTNQNATVLPTTTWSDNSVDNASAVSVYRYGVDASTSLIWAPAESTASIQATYYPKEANTATYPNGNVYNFYGTNNDWYVDGSLQKNNEYAVMKLQLGKRYYARIRAVNASGPSTTWAYVTISDDLAKATKTATHGQELPYGAKAFKNTVSAAETDATKTEATSINLFRLSYSLKDNYNFTNDGAASTTVGTSGTKLTVNSDNQIVNYYNQGSIAILNPNGNENTDGDSDEEADNLLLKQSSDYYWIYWTANVGNDGLTTSLTGTSGKQYHEYEKEPAAYTGYSNLDLVAVYGEQASVTIDTLSKYNLTLANIAYATGTGTVTTMSDSDNSLTADTSDSTVTWTITYPLIDSTPVAYDKVVISVTNTKAGSTASQTYTITPSGETGTWTEDITELPEGKYNVVFKAYHSSLPDSYYGCNAVMTITEKTN